MQLHHWQHMQLAFLLSGKTCYLQHLRMRLLHAAWQQAEGETGNCWIMAMARYLYMPC